MPEETPAQAQQALAQDPTALLLRGTAKEDPALAKTPRNPFMMSAEWRSELVRRVDAPKVVHKQQTVVTARTPQSVNVEGFKLSGILHQDKKLYAILNGRMVSVGMTVENARVVDIAPDRVTLQRADEPDGPTAELAIEPKLQ